MQVVLINPYELGRQPLGLAHPAAWLQQAGWTVHCVDLSLQKLADAPLADADLIGLYVPMHTATRIAIEALPRIRERAPNAYLCVYGLYAPMNAALLRAQGASAILGGEFEPALLALARELEAGRRAPRDTVVALKKIAFRVPARDGLPPLARYAHLRLPTGARRVVGFVEATRGCKHLCRHCPVVPVYQGQFRVLPLDIVMADIRQQIAGGAQHLSFGDPDFLNGPAHALRIVEALHQEFPAVTYDATIKIQHILDRADLLSALKRTGCLFITTAVESVDDAVLERLAKNHTAADFTRATELLRAHAIDFAPTFVPFTPWTTLESYIALLRSLVDLKLVEAVAPVQLSIRLLVPQGSLLLELPDFATHIGAFDAGLLGYPWRHADARVDALQREVQSFVASVETAGRTRAEIFAGIWQRAHAAVGATAPALPQDLGTPVPHMSEPWYCCAEPTAQQLQSF